MSFTYQQSTGQIFDPTGNLLDTGYAGNGDGLNNPAMQNIINVGPIPQGTYFIQPPLDDPELGPQVLFLQPNQSNEMFGRCSFYIHGDNSQMNHSASSGCIILGPNTRQIIGNAVALGENVLEVVE